MLMHCSQHAEQVRECCTHKLLIDGSGDFSGSSPGLSRNSFSSFNKSRCQGGEAVLCIFRWHGGERLKSFNATQWMSRKVERAALLVAGISEFGVLAHVTTGGKRPTLGASEN